MVTSEKRPHFHRLRHTFGLAFAPQPVVDTTNLRHLKIEGSEDGLIGAHIGLEMRKRGVRIGRGKVEDTVVSFKEGNEADEGKGKRAKKKKQEGLVSVSAKTKRSIFHPVGFFFKDVPRYNQISITYNDVGEQVAAAQGNSETKAAIEQKLTAETKHQLLNGMYGLSHRLHHRRWTATARALGTGSGIAYIAQNAVRNVIPSNEPLTFVQLWQYMKSPQSLPDIWNYIISSEGISHLPEAGLFVAGFFLLTKAIGLGIEYGVHRPRYEKHRQRFLEKHKNDDILQVKIA